MNKVSFVNFYMIGFLGYAKINYSKFIIKIKFINNLCDLTTLQYLYKYCKL